MTELDDDIILPNGVILPSPRRILEHDIQHHTAVIDRQKTLLVEISSTEATLRNAIRRHKQSYETLNIRRLVQKQQRYDRYRTLKNDLEKLKNDIISFNQELDRDIDRLRNQATTSSLTNSASPNDD